MLAARDAGANAKVIEAPSLWKHRRHRSPVNPGGRRPGPWATIWARRRMRRIAECYQAVAADEARRHGGSSRRGTTATPTHPRHPPPPGSRETFSSRPLPHTPRIFLFLALNPLVLLLIRFWGGKSQDTSRQEKRNCDAGHIGEDQTGDRVRLWFDRWRRSCHAASASSS